MGGLLLLRNPLYAWFSSLHAREALKPSLLSLAV
jgi:hypothetical protein